MALRDDYSGAFDPDVGLADFSRQALAHLGRRRANPAPCLNPPLTGPGGPSRSLISPLESTSCTSKCEKGL